MAKTNTVRVSIDLDEVRATAERARREGTKLIARLQKDVAALVGARPFDLLAGLRTRAGDAFAAGIDAQRERVSGAVLGGLNAVADRLVARTGLARAHEVAELKRRLEELERRLARARKAA